MWNIYNCIALGNGGNMELTDRMKEQILKSIEQQLHEFGSDPEKPPTEFAVACTWHSDEPQPFTFRIRIERPMRSVATGPVDDKYSDGYTEYYGIDGKFYWGE